MLKTQNATNERIARRPLAFVVAILAMMLGCVRVSGDLLDDLDSHLSVHAFDGTVGLRLSGLLDFEGYYVRQPPPGLIDTPHDFLFTPRLTLNLDVQIGRVFYLFAQARVDTGFDPTNADAVVRLDQYALRITPWEDGRFNVQIGKFSTVVGNWVNRHDSWENPFITAPLPYENLTAIWDIAAADSGATLISWIGSPRSISNPIIWGASYTSGVSVFGHIGRFDYAAEMKNAAISSRPEVWDATILGFDNPICSARIGWRPGEAWNLGVSSSVGTYLQPVAIDSLAPGKSLGDYRQVTLAQDVGYAWHHWQVWAECFESRFEIPLVGNADTFAYYIETKYKFTPQLFGALRWNQQLFGTITNDAGGRSPWGCDIWRVDAALTYRITPHIQTKLQYSYQSQASPLPEHAQLLALQFTVRF